MTLAAVVHCPACGNKVAEADRDETGPFIRQHFRSAHLDLTEAGAGSGLRRGSLRHDLRTDADGNTLEPRRGRGARCPTCEVALRLPFAEIVAALDDTPRRRPRHLKGSEVLDTVPAVRIQITKSEIP